MKKFISLFLILMILSVSTTISFALTPPSIDRVTMEDGAEEVYLNVGESITLDAIAKTYGLNFTYFYWDANDFEVVDIKCDNFVFEKQETTYQVSDSILYIGKGIYCSPPVSSVTVTGLKEGESIITVYAAYNEEIPLRGYTIQDQITVKVVSKPQMYYTGGTFTITSNYDVTPMLALYKENAFVDAVMANELNVSSVDFDEISVIYLGASDTITPLVSKISLTKEQVLALPSIAE